MRLFRGTCSAWGSVLVISIMVLAASFNDTVGLSANNAAEALHRRWHQQADRQCFSWSLTQSLARDTFEYPDSATGERAAAKKGELINLRCDSVVCPNPTVPDCYFNDGVCGAHEWCQLEDQVRFGPWAMADGESPNVANADCSLFKEQGYDWIYSEVCRNESHWGPWKPVRGRCAQYRTEQQSCNAYFALPSPAQPPAPAPSHHHHHHHRQQQEQGRVVEQGEVGAEGEKGDWEQQQQQESRGGLSLRSQSSYRAGIWQEEEGFMSHSKRQLLYVSSFHPSGSALSTTSQQDSGEQQEHQADWALFPQYVVDSDYGRPPLRPMLCAPGLVCTGDVEPTPNTCVKIRPPNTCYQGPWWDSSSWCKVGGATNNKMYGGLPLPALKEAAKALLVQLPVEVYTGPLQTRFWNSAAADVARAKIQGVVAALWPEQYRAQTQFPLDIPDPRKAGKVHSAAWNRTAAEAAALYRQSNKVWSTIQSLIHNCRDPLPRSQVVASRGLAVWLRQHFMCCNCRGMWANYVLNHLGLPPKSSSREDHARWWWRAHNMVSEHAASSRGGHPWVWPALQDDAYAKKYEEYGGKLRCQNPWFLPYEFAEIMWKIE